MLGEPWYNSEREDEEEDGGVLFDEHSVRVCEAANYLQLSARSDLKHLNLRFRSFMKFEFQQSSNS